MLKHYDLLNLKSLLALKCPEKTSWKNFCLKEIQIKWQTIIENELQDLKNPELLGLVPTTLNNKIAETLSNATTWTDLQAIKCMIQITGDSFSNNDKSKKCGKRLSDICTNCSKKETLIHVIYCNKTKYFLLRLYD